MVARRRGRGRRSCAINGSLTLFAVVRPDRPAPTMTKSNVLPAAEIGSSVTIVALARPTTAAMAAGRCRIENITTAGWTVSRVREMTRMRRIWWAQMRRLTENMNRKQGVGRADRYPHGRGWPGSEDLPVSSYCVFSFWRGSVYWRLIR